MRRLHWWIVLALAAVGPALAAPAEAPAGLHNVALIELGATAKGSGAPFNKDWPAINTMVAEGQRGGTIFGHPLTGGRVDIRLVIPVEIKAVEVVGLDYYGTEQVNGIDIYIDGKMVKHADLPETPGKPNRVPVEGKGQEVGIVATGEYPVRTLADGKKGPNWGGWARIRVFSPTDVAALMRPPDTYQVAAAPANIAPTTGALAEGEVKVFGQPRETKGHPCTLWDEQDIRHYKEMLKTSPELQKQYAALRAKIDERMTKPLGIPEPKQGPDGKWLHLPDTVYGSIHNQLGLDIANLGTLYVLSGEEKYAQFCKKLLLAYADALPHYGIGARPGFNHDPSQVFDQRLGDATWLFQVARGYDLIYNSPSITPEERRHIEDDLVKASARHIMGNHAMLEAPTNWSAIATMAVLIAGYAADDPEIINTAFYGLKGTKEKPTGGLFLHFGPKCIDEDGMWSEGSTGYQMMAMEALVADAEILWHHGIDMYRYRDCALKRLFDSPLLYAFPNLTTPAIHDGGGGSIIGYESNLWEYGYERYRDPRYLFILNQAPMNLEAQFQKFPVSLLFDRDRGQPPPPVEWKSVNFFGVGYGILRNTTERATNSLLLDYGPPRSHGHPDKLNIDLYAFGDRLIPDPGSVWYEQPLYKDWYHTTLAHNTLDVDELEQRDAGATQLVYGPAESMGIQRAATDQAYAGVTMDRSLFFTPEYLADLFGAFARLPRKMDLAWHIRGKLDTPLKLAEMKLPAPIEKGYSELTNVRHATTDQAWSADVAGPAGTAHFYAAGGAPTEVIIGDGLLGKETPPAILERRNTNATLYANAVDISGSKEGYVKAVAAEGSLEKGYGLARVQTARGEDLCFAAYRPGAYKAGGLETDAQQAFVLRDGPAVRAMYLAGGTSLKVGSAALSRSKAGLAYVEKGETGCYVVGNPSPEAASVTVTLPALAGMQAYQLDVQGKRVGPAQVTGAGASRTVNLGPASRVEFAAKGVPGGYEYRQEMLRKRQAAQEAVLRKAREEAAARAKARQAAAKAAPAPAGTLVVLQAEDFTNQGGGEIQVTDKKVAAVGKALLKWDELGQWLEWAVDAPADGYYNLSVCYCIQDAEAEREIRVNGQVQEPLAPMKLPVTGGWANGSDDWQVLTAGDPITGAPLLIHLNKGKNTLRLSNANGRACNLDYLVLSSPDVKVTRAAAMKAMGK